MRALILAAGQGTRLRPLTDDRPKCCVEVAGKRLIDWQLQALEAAGVSRVGIVRGYRADALEIPECDLFVNPRYGTTNMVATLMSAGSFFPDDEDLLVAYADIIYEPRLVRAAMEAVSSLGIVVDDGWRTLWEARFADPLSDAETLRMDETGRVTELGSRPSSFDEVESQYIGLIRLGPGMPARLKTLWESTESFRGRSRDNLYMTDLLQLAIDSGIRCEAHRVRGGWCEVDDHDDLVVAETWVPDMEMSL